jgi:hypothetical protein
MKLGTKNKWVEWLTSGRYAADRSNSGLRITTNDGTHNHSILGVLADFLNPNGWAENDFMGRGRWNIDADRPGIVYDYQSDRYVPDSSYTKFYRETWLDVASMKNCKMKTHDCTVTVSTADVTLMKLFGSFETTEFFREIVNAWHMLEPTKTLCLEEIDPGENFRNVLPYIEKYYEQI